MITHKDCCVDNQLEGFLLRHHSIGFVLQTDGGLLLE